MHVDIHQIYIVQLSDTLTKMKQKKLFIVFIISAIAFLSLIGGIHSKTTESFVNVDSQEPEIPTNFAIAHKTDETKESVTITSEKSDVKFVAPLVKVNSEIVASSGGSSGNFLMSTNQFDAIFWGTFDGNIQTLHGEVLWYGNPSLRRVGVGSYTPTSFNSGSLQITFTDPNNLADPGLLWQGTYANGMWSISHNQTGNLYSLTGRVLQAPY
jgi:hypothetical protein